MAYKLCQKRVVIPYLVRKSMEKGVSLSLSNELKVETILIDNVIIVLGNDIITSCFT